MRRAKLLTALVLTVALVGLYSVIFKVQAAADVVTVDGVSIQFPNGWISGTSDKWTTLESPDKSSKFFLMATKNDNFDSVVEKTLNPWLKNSYTNLSQPEEDNDERNGLGLRTLTYEAKRKSDNAKVTITAQLAFVLGDEPPKAILLINVASNNSQENAVNQVFETQKSIRGKEALIAERDDSSVVAAPVKTPAVAANSGGTNCSNVKTPLTNAEIDEILRIHNATRAAVGVQPLKWNCALANFAQSWVNKDVWKHSTNTDREKIIPGVFVGENMSADATPTATMTQMIQGWIDEKKDFNAGTKTCQAGKICGHYTQMVWRKSTEIGCGIIRNSSVMGNEWKGQTTFFVCNYSPGGNDGSSPY